MNSQEAKEILELYRPDSADAQDESFREALELARHDAELSHWFENHCTVYVKIRSQFKRIAVPAGLKEQILSELPRETTAASQSRFSRQTWVLVAGVGVLPLIAIALLWFPFRARNDFASYRNRMVSTALRLYSMDLKTDDASKVRAFLEQKTGDADYTIPAGLNKLSYTGCVVLRWQNKPVSMICFWTGRPLPPGENSDVFLFITDRNSFPKEVSANSLSTSQVSKLTTATWIKGDKTYLLAARGDEEFLRKFLPTSQ